MLFRLAALIAVTVTFAGCPPAAGTPGDAAEADRATDGSADRATEDRAVQAADQADDLIAVELATVGMDALQRTPIVLLREAASGKIIPIWVGVSEANAILRTMLGIDMPRPMTHDLLANVVRELGATVEEVLVHGIQETTYLGRIRLRVGEAQEVLDIDSRPSDALALAIRTDAVIRVAETLLAEPPPFDFLAPEADEQVVRMLGTTVVTPTPALRERFGLADRLGVAVVGASGEAAERGLRRGDLIVEVNGVEPREPMDFLNAVMAAEERVEITYWRGGERYDIELSPATIPLPAPDRRRGPPPIQT